MILAARINAFNKGYLLVWDDEQMKLVKVRRGS